MSSSNKEETPPETSDNEEAEVAVIPAEEPEGFTPETKWVQERAQRSHSTGNETPRPQTKKHEGKVT